MLRVIAGKFRSIPLKQPPMEITRCTTDRIREAIFNVIQNEVKDSFVLDGFAGSGAIAIEAISRGAKHAICTDRNNEPIKIIKENVAKCKIDNIDIYQMDLVNYLKNEKNLSFDLIFLDPPFAIDPNQLKLILELIEEKQFLKPNGIVILETVKDKVVDYPQNWDLYKQKHYGKSIIWFFKHFD